MNQIPNMNRRRVLIGIAAASTTAAPAAMAAGAPTAPAENPALLAAHARRLAAQSDLAAANEALDWLHSEWRHLWPLAPEKILGNAGMETHSGKAFPEHDITGSFIMRNKAELTIRLSKKYRQKGGQTCFSVDTPDELAARLERWRTRKPEGRTAKTLAGNQATRLRMIKELQANLALSRAYYAETKRLREASGVKAILLRQKNAKAAYGDAEAEIGRLPAFTMAGIGIKAAALKAAYEKMGMHGLGGVLGDSYRLAAAIVDASGDVS